MSTEHLKNSRNEVHRLLVAHGFPKDIGPNDKRQCCHLYLSLDGARVHIYSVRDKGFWAYDPKRRLVARAASHDEALITIARLRSPACTEGPNGKPIPMPTFAPASLVRRELRQ